MECKYPEQTAGIPLAIKIKANYFPEEPRWNRTLSDFCAARASMLRKKAEKFYPDMSFVQMCHMLAGYSRQDMDELLSL